MSFMFHLNELPTNIYICVCVCHYQHPTYQFFHLTINFFECLHKQVKVFLHNYANVAWAMKGQKNILLFIIIIFFCFSFHHTPKGAIIFYLKSIETTRFSYLSAFPFKYPPPIQLVASKLQLKDPHYDVLVFCIQLVTIQFGF